MQCALKFLATVEELSTLPDAMQASEVFKRTGALPAKVGGDLRSRKSTGVNMCMLRNCPATGRVIITTSCHRHILKNWRTAVYKGKGRDAPALAKKAYASTLYMAENKVPLEEGNPIDPGSAMSIGEANGLDPMKVSYATKLFSFKFKEALQKQMLVVKDDDLRDSMRHTTKIVEAGAKLDTATDHRGWIIPVRTSMLTDVQDFYRRDVLTGERIDTANPGSHINAIPKGTVENTDMTCFGILQLYEICKARGAKAATHVNTRATCSDVCEQLFSTTQNLTKEQFSGTLQASYYPAQPPGPRQPVLHADEFHHQECKAFTWRFQRSFRQA